MRFRACDAVRRAACPHWQVQPFLSGCGLGARRISPSIDQICVRSRSDSTLRGELPTARCGPRITFVSSKWTTRKVDQVPNTEAFANLPQLDSGGRKVTAQQSIPAEPLHPLMPALDVAIQPLEDPGQLGRDRGLSLAKEPTGIVDQLHPLPKNRRQPPRRHPQVPQAGSRATLCPKPSSAPDPSGDCQTFQVTHPFHPLRGRQFTLVMCRRNWGEHRVYFHDDTGRLVSLPAQWTSVFPADPYVAVAAGRAPFRLHDLLELSQLIARIRQGEAS
jgi:hypothetical protein